MEVKDISEINYAPYNPRVLSDHMGTSLDASINKFGDISGITNNVATNTLVTGHQRLRILQKRYPNRVKIYIQHRLDVPDEYGTVATGFVAVEGMNLMLAYREVSWELGLEKAANLAANKIEATFDEQLLTQVNYELSQLENGDELLALTGQTEDEIAKLLSDSGVEQLNQEQSQDQQKPDDGMQRLTVKLTDEQYGTIYQAIGLMKHDRQLTNEPNDDLDANALYYICHFYIESSASQNNKVSNESVTGPTDQTDLTAVPAE